MTDHLCRIVYGGELESHMSEHFPNKLLFVVYSNPWYAGIVNYLVSNRILKDGTKNDEDRFFRIVKVFIWYDPYLLKYNYYQVLRRCIPDHEIRGVLSLCDNQVYGGILVGEGQKPRFPM